MFDQLKNMASLMKNAGEIRRRAEEFKKEMALRTVEGQSGAGAVRIMLNGEGRTLRVEITPALLAGLAGGDKTMVEELIAAAFNDAQQKLQELIAGELKKAAGGMDMPGLESLMNSQ